MLLGQWFWLFWLDERSTCVYRGFELNRYSVILSAFQLDQNLINVSKEGSFN